MFANPRQRSKSVIGKTVKKIQYNFCFSIINLSVLQKDTTFRFFFTPLWSVRTDSNKDHGYYFCCYYYLNVGVVSFLPHLLVVLCAVEILKFQDSVYIKSEQCIQTINE